MAERPTTRQLIMALMNRINAIEVNEADMANMPSVKAIIENIEAQIAAVENRIPAHYWLNTSLAFEKSNGEIGEYVDLKGAPGKDGHTPTNGELTTLITPLIPPAVPGHTPTNSELTALINPLIPPAIPGTNGKSAYQLAVDAGFAGTLAQWLASLKGEPGTPADMSRVTALESNQPIVKTHTQTFPAIVLGAAYSFDVAITGVTAAMVAIINPTATLGFGTVLEPVCGAGKVTINVKAGLAIAAGNKSFNIRVIR